ncbi:DNA-3-methyladenine glycosylase I [Thalassobaculum sp. OXR-137]|uniref:DNA-3-methyladenine glycosylase I n=1 Tax=Thalassobaculum sp. OXR-137 TaxID=3100173 RepID=UPI002AC94FBA|nr:DNA-3-methyladenine glycosylase I [Thalassobaculum sp. OXR-137]WPZ34129.1 DNA-3-methyladenine glycosylase I [Thalassobaculum sp. OXR-137]
MALDDTTPRCTWPGEHADYIAYHDDEWGRPVRDDIRLFEKICLEGFQSGLSWLTILRKREAFRAGFAGFDFHKVATFGEADVERLLADAGIVRHQGKIRSTINNAQRAVELVEEAGSLAAFIWSFEPKPVDRPNRFDRETLNTITMSDASKALSKALKKRGWSFVGPTTMYAFMQSVGIVNDHLDTCAFRAACEQDRAEFERPTL